MRATSMILSALSATGLAVAQNNVVIEVGGSPLQYVPNSVTAKNGDTITFRFTAAPGNHSVTQSTFADPCTPVSGGFDSGWVFIPQANVSRSPEWTLNITDDSKPIWFYCKQLSPQPHCTQGMVGAINAPSSGNTAEAFVTAARAFNGTVGGQDSAGSLNGVGATASSAPGPLESGAQAFGPPPAASQTGGSSSPPAPTTSGNGNGAASLSGMSSLSAVLIGFGLVMGVAIV